MPVKKLWLYTSEPKGDELLKSVASGSLATKAPLNGQKTQILISLCDKRPGSK
jgi:hypothetical protein